jgi:hypothetical protein
MGCGKHHEGIVVIVHGQPNHFEVVSALCPSRRFACLLHSRQKQRGKNEQATTNEQDTKHADNCEYQASVAPGFPGAFRFFRSPVP